MSEGRSDSADTADSRSLAKALRDLALRVEAGDRAAVEDAQKLLKKKPTSSHSASAASSIDAFKLLREQGQSGLRAAIGGLSREELRTILSAYGLDSQGLARKWKDTDRLTDFIVERLVTHYNAGRDLGSLLGGSMSRDRWFRYLAERLLATSKQASELPPTDHPTAARSAIAMTGELERTSSEVNNVAAQLSHDPTPSGPYAAALDFWRTVQGGGEARQDLALALKQVSLGMLRMAETIRQRAKVDDSGREAIGRLGELDRPLRLLDEELMSFAPLLGSSTNMDRTRRRLSEEMTGRARVVIEAIRTIRDSLSISERE